MQWSPVFECSIGPDESWGDLALGQMLLPHSLDSLVPPSWQPQFQLNGAALEQEGMVVAPGLVSLGSDSHAATFDTDLDVLTEWKAFIDQQVAQRITLSNLKVLK